MLCSFRKWCGAVVAAFCVLAGCVSAEKAAPQRYTFQQPQMGLPFQIILYASNESIAQIASDAAFNRIKELNQIMSDYDPESELSRLSNTSGKSQAVKVSPDLWIVLDRARQISASSDGAFDVTVGPVVALWRKSRREKQLPGDGQIAAAKAAVGMDKMRFDAAVKTVELFAPKMKLDLGGIAKGYAIDEAMKVLKKHGIKSALVSGGGDMLASEPPPGKPGWKVELVMPGAGNISTESAPRKEFIFLRNKALATSGDTFQFLELQGKRYSHIVDPQTGIGLTNQVLVNITANDCTTADGLSTTFSVLDWEKAVDVLKDYRGSDARVVDGLTRLVNKSPGFKTTN